MKPFITVSALGLAAPTYSQYIIWYDTLYDDTEGSLSSVACSTGEYGLITYGYNTFGQIPSYPYLGGAPQVQWGSPYCGSCWELTYTDPHGTPYSVNFTAINSSNEGSFVISFAGIDVLTNGNAETLDGAPITAVQMPASGCGM